MKQESEAMNSLQYGVIALMAFCCILVGCGDSQKAKTDTGPDERDATIAKLQSAFAEARDRLVSQESQNKELTEEIQSLTEKLRETEASARGIGRNARHGAERESPEDRARIALMGAKALAEYKAAQLNERLQALTGDLQRKEKELDGIRQAARTKDSEIATLRSTIEDLKETEKARSTELNAKFERIRQELQKQASDAERFKKDLDDKAGLLQTLKAACVDASTLKAAAESEAGRLKAALEDATKTLQEVRNQSQQFQREFQGLQARADQTAREKEQCRGEAEALRQEVQQQYTMAHNLAAQVAELTSRLQALAPTAQASADDEPSAVDLVLQVPLKGEESETESRLY
jgi:chromosome segregation ATPase